jgi:hypothetical protein
LEAQEEIHFEFGYEDHDEDGPADDTLAFENDGCLDRKSLQLAVVRTTRLLLGVT